jgi:hypothetical protein
MKSVLNLTESVYQKSVLDFNECIRRAG